MKLAMNTLMNTLSLRPALAGLVGAALCLAVAGPVLAGAVYVPVASDEAVGGRIYTTRVWVSNPTADVLQFRTLFIASLADGTIDDRTVRPFQQVPPGATLLLEDVVPLDAAGMLEIDADTDLVFSSELVPKVGEVELPSARVPLVSADNLLPAGQVAQLQGLQRTTAGTVSNVGIVNLGTEATSCSARVYRPGGARVGGTAILTVPPVSHQQFDEALGLLGLQDVHNIRIEISCDQSFYAYATVYGADPEQTLFIQPSVNASPDLRAPGVPLPFTEFHQPGTFLAASVADPYRAFQLPIEPNQLLSRIEVEFDFFLGRFNTDLFHTVTSLRSDGLFFEVAIRGDNSRTFWDTPGQSAREGGPWRAGGSYHIKMSYDVLEDTAMLEVFERGQLVQTLEAQANRPLLGPLDGSLRLDFSQRKVVDNAFFPLWGSRFSNLAVKMFELP